MLENHNDSSRNESEGVPKIVILLVTLVFLLFPVYSVIGKLHKSIGNQPKLIMAIVIGMVLISSLIIVPVWVTRNKSRKHAG